MDQQTPTPRPHLTSTQIGTIGESMAAAQLMLASDGRLSPFAAIADDDGVDLVLIDKTTGAFCQLQVKSRLAAEQDPPPYVQFDLRLKTFTARADGYLLAILLDPAAAAVWRAWLIPAGEIEGAATRRPEKLVISPNPSPRSADRYTRWRCASMREVAERITGG